MNPKLGARLDLVAPQTESHSPATNTHTQEPLPVQGFVATRQSDVVNMPTSFIIQCTRTPGRENIKLPSPKCFLNVGFYLELGNLTSIKL